MSFLSITLDGQEPRLGRDKQVLLCDGRDWDRDNGFFTFHDEVTRTAMLTPAPFHIGWQTQGTGEYARLEKMHYTLTSPDKWTQHPKRHSTDWYLMNKGAVGETVTTSASLERNRGVYLSWFSYNSGNDVKIDLECGHVSRVGEIGTDIWYRFWSDGKVDVFFQAEKIGEGSIADKEKAVVGGKRGEGVTQNHANRILDVMILPCRQKEILFVSNQGGGFSLPLKNLIDEADTDATITSQGPFWWRVPQGQATVQLAPLHFKASGYVLSPVFLFRSAPASGSVPNLEYIYDDPGYGGNLSITPQLMEPDGVTVFSPDGTKRHARLRLTLTGDGTNTPFIYAGMATFFETILDTDGSQATALLEYLRSPGPTLSVPESPADVRLSLPIKRPAALQAAGAAGLAYISNRPVEAGIGGVYAFRGRTEPPDYTQSLSDDSDQLLIECRDWWKALENYRIQEPLPYDYLYLSDAFADLVMMAGFRASDLDIEDIDFRLPLVGAASEGNYALIPEVGDTAADWVLRLHETFASSYFIGFVPTASGVKFRVRSPYSTGTTPAGILFPDAASAAAAGYNPQAYGTLYRSYKYRVIEPEANDIWVTGREPRTGRPIQAHYADVVSQYPALAPSIRPDNWLGEVRRYAMVDPIITTQAAANWAAGVLAQRLTVTRLIAEWECDFLIKSDGSPLWRGDLIALEGKGVFRVLTIEGAFRLESAATPAIWRPSRYTGEWVSSL